MRFEQASGLHVEAVTSTKHGPWDQAMETILSIHAISGRLWAKKTIPISHERIDQYIYEDKCLGVASTGIYAV